MTRGGSRSGEIALGHHVLAGDLGVHDIIEQISQRQRSGSPVTAFLRWLKRYRAPIQVVFGVVAVAFLVWAVLSNWSEMVEVIGSMSPVWVLVSIALAYLGTFANALSWRSVVHSFGARIGVFAAARITFIAQIGKYIPGGVWPMVAGSQLGGQAGIASSTMVVSMTVQLAVSLVAAAVISVGTLLLVPSLAVTYWWVIVLVISCGIVLLLPPVMRRILAFAFRIFRRPDLVPAIRGRHLGSAIGWAVASWALFGLHLCSLFFALGHLNASIVIPAISGYALSWAVGFLAVFAPAGAGVREAILVLLFAGSIGGADVLGVAVVSRMIFILVDVTLFGSSALSWRFSNRNRSAEPRQSETS